MKRDRVQLHLLNKRKWKDVLHAGLLQWDIREDYQFKNDTASFLRVYTYMELLETSVILGDPTFINTQWP